MSLAEKIEQACFGHIDPHIERYLAEPTLETCLPLMQPETFEGFAQQACEDVAALVMQAVAVDEGDLLNSLGSCLNGFASDLQRYASDLRRFEAVLAQSGRSLVASAIDGGNWYGQVGRSLFGTAGLVVGSLIGGALGGRSVEKALDAEGARLQHSFKAMVDAYAHAMKLMMDTAIELAEV